MILLIIIIVLRTTNITDTDNNSILFDVPVGTSHKSSQSSHWIPQAFQLGCNIELDCLNC